MTLSLKLFDGPRDGAEIPVTQAAWPPAEVLSAEGGVYVLSNTIELWDNTVVGLGIAEYQWVAEVAA